MNPDEIAAIERAAKRVMEWQCPTCKDVPHVSAGWVERPGWVEPRYGDDEDRYIPCPDCGGDGDLRQIAELLTAELAPLLEKQAARVLELEGLLREARNDLHYAIRVATSDSSTDMEFTKHARVLFGSEIETIEKIDAALAGTTIGERDE